MKMKEHAHVHTIHTDEHKIYPTKPIHEKTELEGEAYVILSLLQLSNAHTKKWALTMDLPLTLWRK